MRCRYRTILALTSLLAVAAGFMTGAASAQDAKKPDLLVFAAASMTNVLSELSGEWEKASGQKVKLSFAASSVLARQIEAGSSAEVFVSADQEWMDYLATRNLLARATRRDLAGNRLVLIAPADSRVQLTIAHGFKLAAALGDGRLSTGDPDTVPVGRYAKSALQALGVWPQVEGRLVRAENVRAAMTYVARGEAPLGIVYATDAAVEPKVRVIATFPVNSHAPITYPAAALAKAGPDAAAYLAFLGSPAAAPVWKRHGFLELKK